MLTVQERQLIRKSVSLPKYLEDIGLQQAADALSAGRPINCILPGHLDNSPSFSYKQNTGTWRCWSRCSKGGDVVDFLVAYHDISIEDAANRLKNKYGIESDLHDLFETSESQITEVELQIKRVQTRLERVLTVDNFILMDKVMSYNIAQEKLLQELLELEKEVKGW